MSQLDSSMTMSKAVKLLTQFVELGNTKGAYSLREANLLSKAIDILNDDVKDKPVLVENGDNERTAMDLMLQAVQVAQSKGAFGLRDASLAWEIYEYTQKNFGKETTAQAEAGSSGDNEDESFQSVSLRKRSLDA